MRGKTRRIALGAMLAALQTALIWLSGLVPAGRLALCALAGALSAAAVIECGPGWAWLVWGAAGGLGLLLCPLKGPALVFLLFLGWYPIVKSHCERLRHPTLRWLLKLICYALAFGALLLLYARAMLPGVSLPAFAPVLVLAAGAAVFFLYDLLLTGLIQYYLNRKMRL